MATNAHANGKERIVAEVPEGFPAMSEPVKEGERIPDSEIVLSRATESDLLDIADGLHACFPEVWWSRHEPPADRPSYEIRRQRMAKRFSPALKWPVYHPIKASIQSTGEFVGFAGWHYSPESLFNELDSKWMGAFRRAAVEDKPKGAGFQKLMGWSDEEVSEMWSNIVIDSWEGEFSGYDRVRTEDMPRTTHWYLAPLFVLEKFRGRGVGRLLLNWAAEQADKPNPPEPLYLEALPNARPVYLHCGYEAREGPDRGAVMVRNPPK